MSPAATRTSATPRRTAAAIPKRRASARKVKRRKADYESDTRKLKPHHVIAAGIVAALGFVLVLFALVKWITR